MGNARRVLYSPQYVETYRNALQEARDNLHDTHARFLAEMDELRREVAELRDVLSVVVKASRQTAERDVASLRRELEVQLARLERDPRKPLH